MKCCVVWYQYHFERDLVSSTVLLVSVSLNMAPKQELRRVMVDFDQYMKFCHWKGVYEKEMITLNWELMIADDSVPKDCAPGDRERVEILAPKPNVRKRW